jgi:hypothetical protein
MQHTHSCLGSFIYFKKGSCILLPWPSNNRNGVHVERSNKSNSSIYLSMDIKSSEVIEALGDAPKKYGISFPLYLHFGPPDIGPLSSSKISQIISVVVSPTNGFVISIPNFQEIGISETSLSLLKMTAHIFACPVARVNARTVK